MFRPQTQTHSMRRSETTPPCVLVPPQNLTYNSHYLMETWQFKPSFLSSSKKKKKTRSPTIPSPFAPRTVPRMVHCTHTTAADFFLIRFSPQGREKMILLSDVIYSLTASKRLRCEQRVALDAFSSSIIIKSMSDLSGLISNKGSQTVARAASDAQIQLYRSRNRRRKQRPASCRTGSSSSREEINKMTHQRLH